MAATRNILLFAAFAVVAAPVFAEPVTVEETVIVDYRPAVARIEAGDTATARSRLQGVVSRLSIDEGDVVDAGTLVGFPLQGGAVDEQHVVDHER